MEERKDAMSTLSSQVAHRMLAVQAIYMPPSPQVKRLENSFIGKLPGTREEFYRYHQRPSKK